MTHPTPTPIPTPTPTQGPATIPKPRDYSGYDFTRFNQLMSRLQDWRSADHEDAIVLARSHVIEIIEGARAMRALARQSIQGEQSTGRGYPGPQQ